MTPSRQAPPPPSEKNAKDWILGALQKSALLIATLTGAWAFAREVGSSKLDVTTYLSDRRADSLIHIGEERERTKRDSVIDRRTHVLFCKVAPNDSECGK
jgi:hypothetical protein